jgi:hypothetical protein
LEAAQVETRRPKVSQTNSYVPRVGAIWVKAGQGKGGTGKGGTGKGGTDGT